MSELEGRPSRSPALVRYRLSQLEELFNSLAMSPLEGSPCLEGDGGRSKDNKRPAT